MMQSRGWIFIRRPATIVHQARLTSCHFFKPQDQVEAWPFSSYISNDGIFPQHTNHFWRAFLPCLSKLSWKVIMVLATHGGMASTVAFRESKKFAPKSSVSSIYQSGNQRHAHEWDDCDTADIAKDAFAIHLVIERAAEQYKQQIFGLLQQSLAPIV